MAPHLPTTVSKSLERCRERRGAMMGKTRPQQFRQCWRYIYLLACCLAVLFAPGAQGSNDSITASTQKQSQQQDGRVVTTFRNVTFLKVPDTLQQRNSLANANTSKPSSDRRSLLQQQVPATTCNPDVTLTTTSILLSMIGYPESITVPEINQVGKVLMDTYNRAVSCNRAIVDVSLVRGPTTSYEETGPTDFFLEFDLVLSCEGCASSDTTLLTFPFLDDSCPCRGPTDERFTFLLGQSMNGLFQQSNVPNVDIFESQFELETIESCSSSSSDDAPSTFTTTVFTELYGCPINFVAGDLDILAQEFLESYNFHNMIPAYSPHCDRQFREITAIQASLTDEDDDVDLTDAFRNNGGGRRRRDLKSRKIMKRNVVPVNHDGSGRTSQRLFHPQRSNGNNNNNNNNNRALIDSNDDDDFFFNSTDDAFFFNFTDDNFFFNYTDDDFFNSTFFFDDDANFNDDTIGCPTPFLVRFEVTVQCRGCDPASATLFDEFGDVNQYDLTRSFESARRDLKTKKKNDMIRKEANHQIRTRHARDVQALVATQAGRDLQISDCRCPRDSLSRALTEDEMTEIFDFALIFLSEEGILPSAWLGVFDVIEVKQVSCGASVTNFDSSLDIILSTDIDGGVPESQMEQITNLFLQTYNYDLEGFCDPFFRIAQQATVESAEQVPASRALQMVNDQTAGNGAFGGNITFAFNFVYVFRLIIAGNCRFCPGRSSLFGNDGIRRRRTTEMTDIAGPKSTANHKQKSRRMQIGTDCYCGVVDVEERAATGREYFGLYQGRLAASSLPFAIEGFINEEEALIDENARHECTRDEDCLASGEGTFCLANQCLYEGNPRFTLTWNGNDDLDLTVVTPEGIEVWWNNRFDASSRGVFDTDYVQESDRSHVESIYFPESGNAPGGEYTVWVELIDRRGLTDTWTLEIFAGAGNLVDTITGVGSDFNITYDRQDAAPPNSENCRTESPFLECCTDDDCGSGEDCANFQCSNSSSFMFTLEYFGNDDYDLVVVPPTGREILFSNGFDERSGGMWEGDANEANSAAFAPHTERVFFPDDAPAGEYIFYVESYDIINVPDSWTVTVSGSQVMEEISETGSGDSDYFSFLKSSGPIVTKCVFECCGTEQCDENQICQSGFCLTEGVVRFTLQWTGNDDLDIFVTTPTGRRIDYSNPVDVPSGGVFDVDAVPENNSDNVENISFNDKAPFGSFNVGIESFSEIADSDTWSLAIFVDDEEVRKWTGTGPSSFTWQYQAPQVFYCFSADTMLETKRGPTLMNQLQVGDFVLTSDGTFDLVYAFGHRSDEIIADFYQFQPSGLELSSDHMVFRDGQAVPACSIKVGDVLSDGEHVTSIERVSRRGVYAPFTVSGTIIVNGIQASSYVSLQQNSSTLLIGGTDTGISHHWIAHVFEFPHRLLCAHLGINCECETYCYSSDGVSTWAPLSFAKWLLGQPPMLLMLFTAALLLIGSVFQILESNLLLFGLVASLSCLLLLAHRVRSAKQIVL